MICGDCNLPIRHGEQTATGSSGLIHYACFKRATSEGREINIMTVMEAISALQKRVQNLERQVEIHDKNIDFRIGGS